MMRTFLHERSTAALAVVVLSTFVAACERPNPPPAGPGDDGGQVVTRQPAVSATHPLFDRFEGTGFPNDCNADAECHTGGCSSEVCSADPGVVTTCEVLPVSLPANTSCGCVSGQCQWWNPEGLTLPSPPPEPAPTEEASCAVTLCQPPTVCIEYYGIAGPQGPKFVSCEIPCNPADKKSRCPEGMSCVTIADGPGSVCRGPE